MDDKKAFLRRYLDSRKKERELLDELNTLESQYIFPSVNIDGMPHGSGGSDLSGFAAQYDALYQELIKQYESGIAIRKEVTDAIEAMDAPESLKTLLRYRYIMDFRFEKIAAAMDYSWRHTLRLHGDALARFKIPGQ